MIEVQNNKACFVQLWRKLERTRCLLGGQYKRFCIRNVLKSWFPAEANDNFIWEVCHLCEQEGWNDKYGDGDDPIIINSGNRRRCNFKGEKNGDLACISKKNVVYLQHLLLRI